jgi:alpha-tubulin suppressor-like RCC1 family protein
MLYCGIVLFHWNTPTPELNGQETTSMYRSWNFRTAAALGIWLGIAGLVLLVTVSCAPGANEDLQVADREQSVIGFNGITFNGITFNGITFNGITFNGITFNGITFNGITFNGITFNGIPLDGLAFSRMALNGASVSAEEETHIRVLIAYMAECALPEGQRVTVFGSDGSPVVVNGLFGLAPEWAKEPLSLRGQRLVSACLAARANTQGKHVHISLRGSGLKTTPVERAMYSHHEGAFWGNLFGDEPVMHTCTVEGADISGRSCTDGDCGFQSMGSCAEICSGRDATDGHYANCAGDELVLSTFLAVTDELDFGAEHGCIVRDGTPWCWGNNSSGQLGDGTRVSRAEARPLASLSANVVEIGGGNQHTCARSADGSAWCWGDNARGQLGLDTVYRQSSPQHVSALGSDVASISVGADHTCAITTAGALWCWGDNRRGQLGSGSSADLERLPVLVATLGEEVARLALGESSAHACAVTNLGALWCWGANSKGQLGNGTRRDQNVPAQVAATASGVAFGEVTDACTGTLHTCARTADGAVWCWGSNALGQLGSGLQNGGTIERPVRVTLDGAIAQGTLSCGANHTCAIDGDGSVQCWGDNSHGQLGNGSTVNQAASIPGPVVGLDAVPVRVSADAERTCALLDDESLQCWGHDPDGWFLDQVETSAEPLYVSLFDASL